MSKTGIGIIVGCFAAILVVIGILVLLRFGGGVFISDAAFQDCLTVEAMVPMKSEGDINTAINSCASKQRVRVNNVSFSGKTSTTSKIIAVVNYSLPVAGFTINRKVEKSFLIGK